MRTYREAVNVTRSLASAAIVTLLISCLLAPTPAAATSPQPRQAGESGVFTIAVLPDTQNEVYGNDTRFINRTQWIRDNASALNLKYVLHTGDVVSWDTTDHSQYGVASGAMSVLDNAGIPWMGAIGNHDTGAVCPGGSACPGKSASITVRDTTTYNSYFPVSRFPQVEGLFEPGKIDNAWSRFSAGGTDWLVLTLELWPRTQVVDWAARVVSSHPKDNVIVVTHSYLNQDSGIEQGNGGYGATSPQYLYNHVVAPYSNVKLIFSGHIGIAGHRVDTRTDSSKVASFLGTYHSNTTNPTQLITIDTAAGTVSTRFYAPWDGQTWPQYATNVTDMQWIVPGGPQPRTVGLRAVANGQIVTAELAGALPLQANRAAVGPWETFTIRRLDDGNDVALFAAADQLFVCADGAGSLPLIANRSSVGPWETFDLIDNGDGTVSFRSHANGLYVTAESAGRDPLIANRTAIGPWEKFVLS